MRIRHITKRFSIITLSFLTLISLFGPVTICDKEDITREDALIAIEQAEQDMQTMIYENFSVVYINDTLTAAKQTLKRADFAEILRENTTSELAKQAKEALEGLNWQGFTYAEVITYTNKIAFRKNWAYNLSDSIRALELEIQDYKEQGIDTSEARVFLNKSITEFKEERYENAENFLSDAHSNLEAKKAEITSLVVMTEVGRGFIEKYWVGLITFLVIAGVASYLIWRKIKIRKTHSKLNEMEMEKGVLIDLMKKAQIDRFEKANIPESVYYIRMKKYKERLTEIEETIPVFEAMQKESKILGKS